MQLDQNYCIYCEPRSGPIMLMEEDVDTRFTFDVASLYDPWQDWNDATEVTDSAGLRRGCSAKHGAGIVDQTFKKAEYI